VHRTGRCNALIRWKVSNDKKQKLDETMAELQDRWGSTAVRRLGRAQRNTVAHIPTGIPALDDALAIGGLPCGRISEIVGIPTSGMATLALTIASRAQDHSNPAVYIDVGHNFDPDFAARCGLDLDQLVLIRPQDAIQALHILHDFVAVGDIGVLVFDADQTLFSDPQLAKTLATILDKIIAPLSKTKCLLIFLTSLRSIGGSSPNGKGSSSIIPHHSAVRLSIRRDKWLYTEGDISGYRAQVIVAKNKLGPSGKQVNLSIQFSGMVSINALETKKDVKPPSRAGDDSSEDVSEDVSNDVSKDGLIVGRVEL